MSNLFDERFDINDESVSTLTYDEHIARYIFACSLVKGKIVLDIACGTGYGAQILAKNGAKKVIGVDIDQKTVDIASSLNKYSSVEYKHGNAIKLEFASKSVDFITSFETIEHVDKVDNYLSELKRVLTNNGLVLISTPNIEISKCKNPYHLKEYTKQEFSNLVKRYFKHCVIIDQVSGMSSVIRVNAKQDSKLFFGENIAPNYFIAMCSQVEFNLNQYNIVSFNQTALNKLQRNPGLVVADSIYKALVKVPGLKSFLKKIAS
ncbi:class I SAM-dependent methyltransferase [Patescibacteria group bacterium]|nr:class I SAM-dependent methyltransferase [Patescibacteria group bacterium]